MTIKPHHPWYPAIPIQVPQRRKKRRSRWGFVVALFITWIAGHQFPSLGTPQEFQDARNSTTTIYVTSYVPPVLNDANEGSLGELILSNFELCSDKEPLLRQILAAGINVSTAHCSQLPSHADLQQLYGGPTVRGLDTCEAYRNMIARKGYRPMPRIAGLWNTGTSAIAKTFLWNFVEFQTSQRMRSACVPWGRHTPLQLKNTITYPRGNSEPRDYVMPIVLVRDPLWWLQSMCANSYGAQWVRGINGRCPNILPNDHDRNDPNFHISTTTFQVNATSQHSYHNSWFTQYSSLAELWSQWNKPYIDAKFPRLIMRMEDFIYYPELMLNIISNCTGAPTRTPYSYLTGKGKQASDTALIHAMVKYGSERGRIPNTLSADELRYLQTELDPEMMELFHYRAIGEDDIGRAGGG